jgi:hypothetical protein
LAGIVAVLLASCSDQISPGVRRAGRIHERSLHECSGLVASRRFPDVFWTHNDSGNTGTLYGVRRDGSVIGKWNVVGRKLWDWEDITTDDAGNLYLADTGDNWLKRPAVFVHQIKEPDPATHGGPIAIEHSWRLHFPSGPRNCESIAIFEGHAYIVSKWSNAPAEVFRFPLIPTTNVVTLEFVTQTTITSAVTCMAISPGAGPKVLALISPEGAFAYRFDRELAQCHSNWTARIRFKNRKIEGCTFTRDGLLSVEENGHMYLFTDPIFRPE